MEVPLKISELNGPVAEQSPSNSTLTLPLAESKRMFVNLVQQEHQKIMGQYQNCGK